MTASAARSNVTALSTKQPGNQSGSATSSATGNQKTAIQQTIQRSMFALAKGNTYDITEVYSHSSDDKGHSDSVRVKFPTMVEPIIHEVMNTDPRYKSVHDFVRDAVMHRLHYYSINGVPDIEEDLAFQRLSVATARMAERSRGWAMLVEQVKLAGEAMLKDGDLIGLGDFLAVNYTDEEMEKLPHGKRREVERIFEELHQRLTTTKATDY